jgi:uncharacterized protein (UPF0548 family)
MRLVRTTAPPDHAAYERWRRVRPSSSPDGPPGAILDRYEATVPIPTDDTPAAAFDRIRARLLTYDIFPPGFVQGTIFPSGPLAVDTIVVQRIGAGPIAVEVAVKVVELRDERANGAGETSFQYVTLDGHLERGIASFGVSLLPDGTVTVLLTARSLAGHWLAQLGRPIARRVQQSMTRKAVRRLVDAGRG